MADQKLWDYLYESQLKDKKNINADDIEYAAIFANRMFNLIRG